MKTRKKTILGALVGLCLMSVSVQAKSDNQALVKCSMSVESYAKVLQGAGYIKSHPVIDDKICDQQGKECSSLQVSIPKLGQDYTFEVYLTSENGEDIELNMAINKAGYSQVSRDLTSNGFLTVVIEDQHIAVGCGVQRK